MSWFYMPRSKFAWIEQMGVKFQIWSKDLHKITGEEYTEVGEIFKGNTIDSRRYQWIASTNKIIAWTHQKLIKIHHIFWRMKITRDTQLIKHFPTNWNIFMYTREDLHIFVSAYASFVSSHHNKKKFHFTAAMKNELFKIQKKEMQQSNLK